MAIYENELMHEEELDNDFYHSGVKGMHWGERRYQYEDGSYTPLGREHYGIGPAREPGSKYDKVMQKALKEDARYERYRKELDAENRKHVTKISDLQNRAARTRAKKRSLFAGKARQADLERKAQRLDERADSLASKSRKLEAKLMKSEALIAKYNDKLVKLDSKKVDDGKKIVDSLVAKRENDSSDSLETEIRKKFEKPSLDAEGYKGINHDVGSFKNVVLIIDDGADVDPTKKAISKFVGQYDQKKAVDGLVKAYQDNTASKENLERSQKSIRDGVKLSNVTVNGSDYMAIYEYHDTYHDTDALLYDFGNVDDMKVKKRSFKFLE